MYSLNAGTGVRHVSMTRSHKLGFLAAALGIFTIAAATCNGAIPPQDTSEPIWPTKAWQTSSPEEQGMDSKELADLVDFGTTHSFDSLLVTRHGRIVAEAYYAPYAADVPHTINSCTKSVIGTLVAIAFKDGLLDSTDRRALDFFDRTAIANLDNRKEAITVQNLLDMTSGLEWEEPFGIASSVTGMVRSPDWVKFILDRPMSGTPGETFHYSSGNAHLLSAILTKLTGISCQEYAKAKLFGPLGIRQVMWRTDPQGITTGPFGLFLLPRDMAKIGYLYLRDGEWEGKQLLPTAWIDKIAHATIDMHGEPGDRYSNLFWALPDKHVYMAVGFNRQMIMIFPKSDVVAVTTAQVDHFFSSEFAGLVSRAVKSDTSLPADEVSAKLLANKILDVATEKATEVGPTSKIAGDVSGKVYRFAANQVNLKSFSLILNGPQPHYDIEIYNRETTKSWSGFTGPIGLDGSYRKGELIYHGFEALYEGAPRVNAVKGTWRDDHTFVIDCLALGDGRPAEQWTLTFNGDKLDLRLKLAGEPEISIDGETGG
jgi:CubicO group peptidase (beta-lactamase class C family)